MANSDLVNPEPNPSVDRFAETHPEGLPEKYQGKTPAEIAQMHANAEQAMSRQGQELGQMRQELANVQAMLAQQNQQQQDPFDERIMTDPEVAVNQLVDQKLRPVQEMNAALLRANFQRDLDAVRPDWRELMSESSFQTFVAESDLNKRMFNEANENLSLEAAKSLLSAWDLNSGGGETVQKAVKSDRKRRAAVTEAGSPAISKGNTFKRSELQALKQNNPALYEQRLPEIKKAYQEGRVKN